MRTQKGFTLIELIIVIVILGILAAFAIPRFYDFGGKARTASINSLLGSVNSASAIGHGVALANNLGGTASGSVSMDGVQVAFINGYPDATTNGIGTAVTISSGSYTTNFSATAAGSATWQVSGATTPAQCQVQYTASVGGATPSITAITTGC